jgi:hypothetical protein
MPTKGDAKNREKQRCEEEITEKLIKEIMKNRNNKEAASYSPRFNSKPLPVLLCSKHETLPTAVYLFQ